MLKLLERSLKRLYLGKWDFYEITLEDIDRYTEFIKATEYQANLWSSNFAYLWAASQSRLRRVLWRVVDDMLVTFGHSYKNSLYLYCLPFGQGKPEKLISVLLKCMEFCYEWNNHENNRTMVRMINDKQLDFLRECSEFDHLFKRVTLHGIERHLDVKKLVSLAGKDFSTIRNKVNKFHRENPDAILRRYQSEDYDKLIDLGEHWNKVAKRKRASILDKTYYRVMINYYEELKQTIFVAQKGNQIVGMVAGGVLPTGQAWGSLLKYKDGIPGLSELLSIEFVREIHKINPEIAWMNVGSDLGAGGLRDYKLKFRPALNLKRYQIYIKR